jgi:lipopolysaccharide export system permease protein
MLNFNEKIVFNKLFIDVTKFLLLITLSLSLIIGVVQAVNFLDYISEDGQGLKNLLPVLPKLLEKDLT